MKPTENVQKWGVHARSLKGKLLEHLMYLMYQEIFSFSRDLGDELMICR